LEVGEEGFRVRVGLDEAAAEERRWEAASGERERSRQARPEARRVKKFSSPLKKTWKMVSVLLPVLSEVVPRSYNRESHLLPFLFKI
jgi:hypothetical protein